MEDIPLLLNNPSIPDWPPNQANQHLKKRRRSNKWWWIDANSGCYQTTKYILPKGLEEVSWKTKAIRGKQLVYCVPEKALGIVLKEVEKERDVWKHLYILNKLQIAYFTWQANEKSGYYAKLPSASLNKVMRSDYRKVLNLLIRWGILEEKKGFCYSETLGEMRRTHNLFRLNETMHGKLVRIFHNNEKKAAKAHELSVKAVDKAIAHDPLKRHLWDSLQRTTIDDEAFNYVESPLSVSIHQRECYRMSVGAIFCKELYIKSDYRTGRVFTNVTNLWKQLRSFLSIDGESVCEVDIRNCQPLLASLLYPDESEERQKYLEVVLAGNFYRYLEKHSGRRYPDYGHLKKLTFKQVFFGKNSDGTRRPLLRALMKEFPEMYEIITEMKKRHKNRLALALQEKEAFVVIHRIVPRLMNLGVPCLTVHDSVICKQCDEQTVWRVMSEELRDLIGRDCQLKVTR